MSTGSLWSISRSSSLAILEWARLSFDEIYTLLEGGEGPPGEETPRGRET